MLKNLQLTKNNQHGIIYTEKITGKVGFMRLPSADYSIYESLKQSA